MPTTLHWLGVGSGLNLSLTNPSFFVTSGGPRVLLVDCGFTVPAALHEAGMLGRVTDVLLTHLHSDHIGGLETFGFERYHVFRHRGANRPTLHVPTESMAHDLWEHSLRAGMEHCGNETNPSFIAGIDEYFQVRTGLRVAADGLPAATFVPTNHIPNMANYAVRFDNGVYYSGDSNDLPPPDAKLIFQDVHFSHSFPDEVHTAYETLRDDLPPDVRARTWLVHLGRGYENVSSEKDGFAGTVKMGQVFTI
jgi:ribonuclease BN (tRNA processing enzyme)